MGANQYPQKGGGVEDCMPNITYANKEEEKNLFQLFKPHANEQIFYDKLYDHVLLQISLFVNQ